MQSQEDIESAYTRLSHYINTMGGNGSSNTKLGCHSCRISIDGSQIQRSKDDYSRCIDMLKELKEHNIAVHTDMAHRLTVSETNAEDLRVKLKEKTKNVDNYETDAKSKSKLIKIFAKKCDFENASTKQKVVVEDLQNTLARKEAVRTTNFSTPTTAD